MVVSLNSQPICKVKEIGGIAYRQEYLYLDELVPAKDCAYEIARTTAEYMRAMRAAPPFKATGLEDGYRLLAEFNGAVLAGHPTERGVQFITWERDLDRTGVCYGHYPGSDYTAAKQDFTVRAGLIDPHHLFTSQQLAEVCRMKAVSATAYHAHRKSFSSEQERWRSFLDHLDGKALTRDVPEIILRGQRPLDAADISFSDEIMQNDNLLESYMDVTFDPDKAFGAHVCTAENDNYLNLYASYDMDTGQVCDALTVILVRNDDEAELTYPLNDAERTAVQFKMDEYCQQRLGHGLAEYLQEYLAEEQAAQEEITQGPALTL